MLAEVNRARQSPQRYAATVARIFAAMDRAGVYPRANGRVATAEGRAAVDEALHELARREPVPPLRMASCLNRAASRHARTKGNTGSDGHVDPLGRGPSARASAVTSLPVHCAENIAYGYDDIAETVAALIVDDGVPGRGHRLNLFDPRMTSFGSAHAAHLLHKRIDVQMFCMETIRDVPAQPTRAGAMTASPMTTALPRTR